MNLNRVGLVLTWVTSRLLAMIEPLRFGLFLLLTLALNARAAETREPLILVLGDSIAEGFGIQAKDAFPKVLEDLLKQQGYPKVRIKSAGISGSTSASAIHRLTWHLKSKEKPDVVILELGANDGLRALPVGQTRLNLKRALELILASGATPVLTGMKLPLNYGQTYRADFEKVFNEVAKIPGVVWMPFLLKDVGGDPTLNIGDGMHPNEKGQKIIAKNLIPYVKQALKKSKKETVK